MYTADECSDTVFVFTSVLNFFHGKALLDYFKHAVVCVVWHQSHSAKSRQKIGSLIPYKLSYRNSGIIFLILKQYTIEIVRIIKMFNPGYQTFFLEKIRNFFEKR